MGTTNGSPSVHLQDPTHFIWLVSAAWELPWLPTILVYISSKGDTQKTKLHSSQMNPCPDRLLLLLWRAPDLAHPAAAHPVNMDSSIKVIVIVNVHDPQDMLGYLPVPLVNVAPVDLVLTLWQTKETSCEEHSTLWDDGIGPKRSQCLYLIRH